MSTNIYSHKAPPSYSHLLPFSGKATAHSRHYASTRSRPTSHSFAHTALPDFHTFRGNVANKLKWTFQSSFTAPLSYSGRIPEMIWSQHTYKLHICPLGEKPVCLCPFSNLWGKYSKEKRTAISCTLSPPRAPSPSLHV